MTTSPAFSEQLARAYREARVLVLGDRGPKVDRAFALHREFIAIRAVFRAEQDDDISDWEATFLERIRRATIVALRHQALAIKDRWSESRGPLGDEQSSPDVKLEHALQLSTAAMQLHLDDDPDVSRTAQVVAYIRQTMSQMQAPAPPPLRALEARRPAEISTTPEASDARAPSILPAARSAAVTPPELDSPPEPAAVVAGPGEVMSPAKAVERSSSPRRLSRLALLAAAGFVFVIGVASAFWRFGTVGPVAAILLKSEPSGVQVTVGGEFRGTTPLNFESTPGKSLSVVVKKGNRVWRGVLQIGAEDKQTLTVRLPLPVAGQSVRPQPTTAALRSSPARFDTVLREGIELYKNGWFGPAAGRFKEALTIDPRSPLAYLWFGRALIRSDRQVEARHALEKVIELAQTGPQADEAAALLRRLP